MAGFTKKFVKRELIITMKSHKTNFRQPCLHYCDVSMDACGLRVRACVCGHIYIYTKPRQQKFRAMNGAHLASPIRGELGYAHWPQLGTQFIALLGTKFGAH